MRIVLILLISFFLLLNCSCSTTSNVDKYLAQEKTVMDSWVGSTKAQLIQSWGPPLRTESDAQGGEILIYENQILMPKIPGTVYSTGHAINYTTPSGGVIIRQKMFYVNPQGIVYHWIVKGKLG